MTGFLNLELAHDEASREAFVLDLKIHINTGSRAQSARRLREEGGAPDPQRLGARRPGSARDTQSDDRRADVAVLGIIVVHVARIDVGHDWRRD